MNTNKHKNGPITPELIADVSHRKLCKNCRFHKHDGDDIVCDHEDKNLGDNIPCPGFELSDEQLKHTINDLNDVILNIKNKGSLYLEIGATIATIALLIWLGLEARLEWLIISIFVILAICIFVFVVSHKKSRKYELEVIKRMVKLRDYAEQFISKERIIQSLTNMGYAPQQYNDGIVFKYGDLNMVVAYNNGFLTMHVRFKVSDDDKIDLGTFRRYTDELTRTANLIKAFVIDDSIVYAIEAHMLYMDELERYFEHFAHWLSNSHDNVMSNYEQENDPTLGRNYIYSLAYRLVPAALSHLKNGKLSIEDLWNEELMRDTLRRHEQYVDEAELAKFRVLSVSDYGEIKQVVYQFPEPQIAPEAKYGAVLVNTRTLECQYYTLEMSDNGLWFYCGVNGEQHLNYGEAKSSNLESFITWVLSQNKSIEAQSTIRSNNPSQPN